MKKFLLIFFLIFAFTGCSVEVLSPPKEPETMSLIPSEITLKDKETKVFVLKAYDKDGKYVPVTPVWSVEGEIGEISSDGVFYAYLNNPAISHQEGYVVATYNNLTAKAHVTVTAGELGIYSETYSGVIYDTVNAYNNPLAVIMGRWTSPPGSNWVHLSDSYSQFIEGNKSLRCFISNTGGMYVKFGTFKDYRGNWSGDSPVWTNRNLIAYYQGTLELDFKANAKDFYLKIEFKSELPFEKRVFTDILGISPDTNWHHMSIPLTSANGFTTNALKEVIVPFGAHADSNFPVEIYLDNIYYKPAQ